MKRISLTILTLFVCAVLAFAQNDTLVIRKPIQFDTEEMTSKVGNTYVKYYVFYEGKYYESNKSSMDRYYQILRFGGQPCVVLITTGKTRKQKIIVL